MTTRLPLAWLEPNKSLPADRLLLAPCSAEAGASMTRLAFIPSVLAGSSCLRTASRQVQFLPVPISQLDLDDALRTAFPESFATFNWGHSPCQHVRHRTFTRPDGCQLEPLTPRHGLPARVEHTDWGPPAGGPCAVCGRFPELARKLQPSPARQKIPGGVREAMGSPAIVPPAGALWPLL
ncbi:hypothetical protein FALBO_8709 [Fusarium albosuccineum]|uniref:Uncharacterized protein n=1 Tax=Fusarium albosuccineum TaxID=1237068 RepID=A0A8H4P9P2_9HYPO|nr:hypothetical protein FALBO_8709 [Fusarium albosuccineum]